MKTTSDLQEANTIHTIAINANWKKDDFFISNIIINFLPTLLWILGGLRWIDTDDYSLQEEIANVSLRLCQNIQTDKYVARIGDRVYTSLKEAITKAQNGDTIYIIDNITMTETINVEKNIKIMAETAATKNDDNILDKNLRNANGSLINQSTMNFRYHPLGDYTISLVSSFGDNSNNTSGFIVKNGGNLSFGDEQYNEADVSVLNGGFIGLDGNGGHEING